jgi:hypothetical protein
MTLARTLGVAIVGRGAMPGKPDVRSADPIVSVVGGPVMDAIVQREGVPAGRGAAFRRRCDGTHSKSNQRKRSPGLGGCAPLQPVLAWMESGSVQPLQACDRVAVTRPRCPSRSDSVSPWLLTTFLSTSRSRSRSATWTSRSRFAGMAGPSARSRSARARSTGCPRTRARPLTTSIGASSPSSWPSTDGRCSCRFRRAGPPARARAELSRLSR